MIPALPQLPWNILMQILNYLSINDIGNLMVTCRAMSEFLTNENSLWRNLCRNEMVIQGNGQNRIVQEQSFYNKCRMSHNWREGYYMQHNALVQETKYMPWIEYHDSEVVIVSLGPSLKCYRTNWNGHRDFPRAAYWELTVPTENRCDKRTNDISRFVIKHDHLVCGNRDGCATVYQITNKRHQPSFVRHIKDCHNHGEVEVSAVELFRTDDSLKIVTASESSTQVSIWDGGDTAAGKISAEATRTVTIPDCLGIRCLSINDNESILAMGPDGNNKPLVLDITTGEVIWTATGTQNKQNCVRDIIWHDQNNIAYVSHLGVLRVADVRTGKTVYSASDPFGSSMYCVKSDGQRAFVVGTSQHARCVLYDCRNTLNCFEQIFFTQKTKSPLYCLDFDSRTLIAAADHVVSILDFDVSTRQVQRRDHSLEVWY